MIDYNDITNKNKNADNSKKSEKEITQQDEEYNSQSITTIYRTDSKNRCCQKIKNACKNCLKIITIILNIYINYS